MPCLPGDDKGVRQHCPRVRACQVAPRPPPLASDRPQAMHASEDRSLRSRPIFRNVTQTISTGATSGTQWVEVSRITPLLGEHQVAGVRRGQVTCPCLSVIIAHPRMWSTVSTDPELAERDVDDRDASKARVGGPGLAREIPGEGACNSLRRTCILSAGTLGSPDTPCPTQCDGRGGLPRASGKRPP